VNLDCVPRSAVVAEELLAGCDHVLLAVYGPVAMLPTVAAADRLRTLIADEPLPREVRPAGHGHPPRHDHHRRCTRRPAHHSTTAAPSRSQPLCDVYAASGTGLRSCSPQLYPNRLMVVHPSTVVAQACLQFRTPLATSSVHPDAWI